MPQPAARGRAVRIASIASMLPEHEWSNDALLEYLRNGRSDEEAPARAKVLKDIRQTLDRCGTRTRFYGWARPGYALDLVREASEQALAEANVSASEIDFIIYCSVARGWLEPSTAAAIQHAIGAEHASCFDIIEACAAWMRAMQTANAFLKTGVYKRGLLVGVEAGMRSYSIERELENATATDLASFTVGEGATATVVEAGATDDFACEIRSLGQYHDLCMLPLQNVEYFLPRDKPGAMTPNRFYVRSDKLFFQSMTELVDMLRPRLRTIGLDTIDLFILHAASSRAGHVVRRTLDIPESKWFCPHDRFANTAAMSIPLALATAVREGRLSRGDRLSILIAAGGISIGYGMFTY